MEIFKLFGTILVDSAKAEESISKTEKKADGLGTKLGNGIKTAGKWAAGIGTAAGVVGGAMLGVATKAADAAGEIDDMAQRTGVTAEEFQKYAYAAKLSGMETATLEKAMIKSQTAFADAKNGSKKMSEAYKALGVDIENIGSSSEAFDEVIMRLADMEDETQRNAIANDIFGKSYAELSPMLNSGSAGIKALKDEAVALGGVMSNEAVSAGAEFGDAMDKAKTMANGLFMQLGTALMPILMNLLTWVTEHMPEIQEFSKEAFETISDVVSTAWKLFSKYLSPALEDLWNFISPTFPLISEAIEIAFIAISTAVQTGIDIFNGVADAIQKAINLLNEWNGTEVKRKQTELENGRTTGGSSGKGERGVNGSHAAGLAYVPFDGYIAEAHEGEGILTKEENKRYRNAESRTGDVIITGNSFVVREEADIKKIARELYNLQRTKERGTALA
jgi:hypothetical protein